MIENIMLSLLKFGGIMLPPWTEALLWLFLAILFILKPSLRRLILILAIILLIWLINTFAGYVLHLSTPTPIPIRI
ncbi:MAG: hypothetical protein QXH03_07800 [Candidatus Bathyarchaeia archaeon]